MTNQLNKFSTEDMHVTVKHKDRGEIMCSGSETNRWRGETKTSGGKDYKK